MCDRCDATWGTFLLRREALTRDQLRAELEARYLRVLTDEEIRASLLEWREVSPRASEESRAQAKSARMMRARIRNLTDRQLVVGEQIMRRKA